MIALDTCVLIDLISDHPRAEQAELALRDALALGPVVVCEVVVSEAVAGLGHGDVVVQALEESGVGFLPLEMRSAVRAGEMQRRYKARQAESQLAQQDSIAPNPKRSVPDFLIGAHALLQCQGLITRDAVFFRDYFKGLKVIVPQA